MLFFGIFGLAKSSRAAAWYVDNTVSSSGNGQSWATAWKNPDNVVWGAGGVQAGDTLYISGGSTSQTYLSPVINPNVSGTSGHPITIATGKKSPSPTGHDGLVIFDGEGTLMGFISTMNVSYLTIDGEKNGAINWRLQNMILNDPSNYYQNYHYAIYLGDSGSFVTSNVKVLYVEITGADSGISVLFNQSWEIAHCWVHNIYHEVAIDGRGSPAVPLGTNKIHDNIIENASDPTPRGGINCGPDAIQGSGYIDVYNNVITTRSGTTYGYQHPDQIQDDWNHTRVFNNIFKESGGSLFQNSHEASADIGSVSDVWIYNNVMIGFQNGMQNMIGGNTTSSITRLYMLNNTLVDIVTGSGFYIPSATAVITDVQLKNNIFINSYWNLGVTDAQCAAGGITYSNNDVYGTSLACNTKAFTNTNGQTGLPAFAKYTHGNINSDVALSAGDTVARDRGADLSAIFSTDILGVSRPQGSAWDIGAYEYVQGGDTIPPASPTGLTVN
jgi:hypothetical protein